MRKLTNQKLILMIVFLLFSLTIFDNRTYREPKSKMEDSVSFFSNFNNYTLFSEAYDSFIKDWYEENSVDLIYAKFYNKTFFTPNRVSLFN